MRQICILRAIPGSFKTSRIPHLEEQYGSPSVVCSADHFHYYGKEQTPENYKFDIKMQGKAHQSCKDDFVAALEDNEKLIIVDNTNINEKDYLWYYRKAREYQYNVTFHTIRGCTAEQSFKSNVHSVPLFVIENMLKNFKPTLTEIDGELTDEILYDFNELRKNPNGKTNQKIKEVRSEV